MKSYSEELLWNYIDGSCSEEERAQIEQALKTDPELKKALAERMALHQALQKIEAEEPSMRFVTNIMERLPDIRFKFSLPPLVSPQLKRRFLLGTLSVFTLIIALVFSLPEGQSTADGGATTDIGVVSFWVEWSTSLVNSPITLMVASVSLSFIIIMYLDRFLKKQFLSKKTLKES